MSGGKETLSVSSIPEPSDLQAVTDQIGRAPRGQWTVARRCDCGLPMVIQTNPRLDDGTPFPTFYWLTCKKLSSQIGTLEASGWMAIINEKLRIDDAFRDQLVSSTRALIDMRDAIEVLGQDDHPGGGPSRIKCAHAHVAHHLVTGDNPVGREALIAIGWAPSQEACL